MPATDPSDRLLAIIRPIVEGQIRGFLKEHPAIVDAVDWYKPRLSSTEGRAQTFTGSLAKRIVRDLVCRSTTARMAAALSASNVTGAEPLAIATGGRSISAVEGIAAAEAGRAGTPSGALEPQ